MKKLFTATMLLFGLSSMNAQDSASVMTFSIPETLGENEPLTAHVDYITSSYPDTVPAVNYTWSICPVDMDGNYGDPIFTETTDGSPIGDYTFPESIHSLMTPENNYAALLSYVGVDGGDYGAGGHPFLYTSFVLNGPKEVCCGEGLNVVSTFTGNQMVYISMQYQWKATMCDAQGNPTWPLSYYDSGILNGFPVGPFTIPNSALPFPTGVACDQYYRVDLIFYPNGVNGGRPVTRTVIIYVSSFLMTANPVSCQGQYVIANPKYCQGPNSPQVTGHTWQMFNSNAQGVQGAAATSAVFATGAPLNGPQGVPWSNTLPSGYYLVKLSFLNGVTPVGVRTALVFINPPVTASISGASSSCGYDSYTALPTGAGYTYQWSAFNGSASFPNVYQSTSNCSVGWGYYTSVKVIVTDNAGCKGTAVKAITNTWHDPDFQLIFHSIDANNYYVEIKRAGNYSTAGYWDLFKVEDMFTHNGNPTTNNCWTNPPTPLPWGATIYMYGYNSSVLPTNVPCSVNTYPNNVYPYGQFKKADYYRIEHHSTLNGGCYQYRSKGFNWANGVNCTNCRISEDGTILPDDDEQSINAYPNPNEGEFTIELSEPGENVRVEIYNTVGARVDAVNFSGASYIYSSSDKLSPGIYMLRVLNNGVVTNKKIVVQ